MQSTYRQPEFAYARSPDQSAGRAAHHPVIVAGAGPVGLAAALDLAQHGVEVVLLDEDNTSATPSARWRSSTGWAAARRSPRAA